MDPLTNSAAWPPPPPYFPPPPPISAASNNAEPPYPDMIIAAITALKEREGSSRQAIDRYIQSVYTGNLPSNHPTLLTYHLKRMKNEASLSMIKHSYTLPGFIPPPPPPTDPTPKRPRGRPPKTLTEPSKVPFTEPSAGPADGPGGPNAENMLVSLGLVDGPGSSGPVKRGRGRPRLGLGSGAGPVKGPKERKPRGRPPRVDRGATRPPKTPEPQVVAGGKQERRGRPPKKVSLPGSKPRGRPRKFPIGVVPGGGVPVVGMKRRGRPPKAGGGQVKMPKRVSVSGKPMGRPRKDALSPASQQAAQHLVAYQDLLNKYGHFQSRVKQAVDLVRPYFTTESTPYVCGALQELEQLANIDMTAPAPPPPQAPPQAPPQQPPFAQS